MPRSRATGTDRKPRRPRFRPTQRVRSVLLAMEFYIAGVHEGVVRYARQAGWILDASMMHRQEIPADWRGDGVLAEMISPEMEQRIVRLGVPIVAMVTPAPSLNCPSVLMDNLAAGRLAAEHLMERGFKRLVYYQHTGSRVLDERCESFAAAARTGGCQFVHLHGGRMPGRWRKEGRIAWLADSLRRLRPPLGVFADSDEWALEAMNACRLAELSIPEQVAVIGVDNNPLYVDVAPVPLSSVDNDLSRVGYEAAAILDRVLDGQPPPPAHIVIPPVGVVARRSTDILAVEDVKVAKALGFMRQHFRHRFRMEDVADHCGISLRRLQELFRRTLGRSMIRELTRLRLECAMRLLRQTDQKVEPIARQSGFAAGVYLNKVMMRHVGRGPAAYRRQHERTRGRSESIPTGRP